MSEYQTAQCVADFNETDFKKFATRIGDGWTFTIPPSELQNIEDLIPDHVLSIEKIRPSPGMEIMLGKLTRKK
ncbi:hypothetical protein UFOVP1302_60 [uncultured Caudovirales phage]|uniref:Uncharacterized protein n=1 Tax=uncultured Caudovirales phage TaxID=2100421 RepID=A0A6J5SDA3_9CAUD|nr:hypothetical protein UFOVP895_63 [uncultured Caudovirales phage]CAB4181267.1 hypothetical protein UFOVP1070_24 [uncultured Caudovirales phage]CAB4196185.1 hypothetical protein UFOVP1302_60 [uncultured Caudovirales phage]CAB4211856.1 hypothetical protein UFOVP1416_52 [uncultured Caudovirales phage]